MNAIMNEKGRQTKLLAAIAIIAMIVCALAVVIPSDVNGEVTATAEDAESPIISVQIGEGEATSYNASNLSTAISAINSESTSNVTVTVLQNFILDITDATNNQAGLWFSNGNAITITINGGDHTITADNTAASGNKNVIGFTGDANYELSDLTIIGSDATHHGVNIFAADVEISNVKIQDNGAAGIVVNGGNAEGMTSTVTGTGITTSGNGWYGINVDNKSGTATLNLTGTNSIGEVVQIFSESGNITAEGFTSYAYATDANPNGHILFANGVATELNIPTGATITVADEQTLKVTGTLTISGELNNQGTVSCDELIVTGGTVTGNAVESQSQTTSASDAEGVITGLEDGDVQIEQDGIQGRGHMHKTEKTPCRD